MEELTSIAAQRGWVGVQRGAGKRIGFVPTMGFLHEGHLSLVDAARRESDVVVMSIFVNPLQFAPSEDLDHYPRDLRRDRDLAEGRGVDALFLPTVTDMYPRGSETRVVPGATANRWEGEVRPGHFAGVLTVVAKLFHLVEPDVACFGQKDVQQATLVRQMVRDLDWPIRIRVCRTTRDADVPNGAEFTTVHVSRGAAFLRDYLPKIERGHWANVAAEIIHYTGYERPFKNIHAPDPRDHKLGHFIGTADLMAQMADRCYLEKCRDRLYAEFVLAGVALPIGENGHVKVRYASGLDLLRQTPKFVFDMRAKRLDGEFNRAYRYLEILYNGRNPYMESIDRNLEYLQRILRSENWRLLRRQPPVFTGVEDSMATTRTLMLGAIKKVWG
jgi:hypothetical protein